jgi:hypothetical protein
MDWSLGSFGDVLLDEGGLPSSNEWLRVRPFACADLAVSVVANCGPGRFFANPKVTAEKIVADGACGPARRAPADTCWQSKTPPR